tara:strand:+ start:3491 stop:3808 length:318 start_codon:yes stop_codon:yes gene_type:complete
MFDSPAYFSSALKSPYNQVSRNRDAFVQRPDPVYAFVDCPVAWTVITLPESVIAPPVRYPVGSHTCQPSSIVASRVAPFAIELGVPDLGLRSRLTGVPEEAAPTV